MGWHHCKRTLLHPNWSDFIDADFKMNEIQNV